MRILFFACDPGGANTVLPLVAPLRERGHEVRLFGKGVAMGRFREAGYDPLPIDSELPDPDLAGVQRFLQRERPAFVCTGTSAEDATEKFLWKAADSLGIRSFAILDQWINYGIRFSPWGVSRCAAYEAAPEHPFLPTRIIVMDDFARDEMVSAGIAGPGRILALGQPYFETLLRRRDLLPAVSQLRESLGVDEEFVVTFVSEPLSQDYGEDPEVGTFWGFSERTIFRSFRTALLAAAQRQRKKTRLLIKRHPRESADSFADLLQGSPWVTVCADFFADPMETIHISDLVCGMSSMMLIEAAIVGRPILSMLVGLRRESPFVLDRRGLIASARSESENERRLDCALAGESIGLGGFEVKKNPVDAIVKEMEKMLS